MSEITARLYAFDGLGACLAGDVSFVQKNMTEAADTIASLTEEVERLRTALIGVVDLYCDLINSGDCGFWDPEKVDEIKHATDMTANMREALEAAERYMSIVVKRIAEIAPDEDAGPQADIALQEYMRAKAALSAVPAPVSEEEIALVAKEMAFLHGGKMVMRAGGETHTVANLRGYGRFADDLQRYVDRHWSEYKDAARAILSRLSREGDPEESIRTRLDDQHVKSSGGVRTSTGKE